MDKAESEKIFADSLGQFGNSTALDMPGMGAVTYERLSADVDVYSTGFGSARRLILLEFATTYKAIVAYLAALKTRNPVILADPGKRTANERTAEQFGVELFISSAGSIEERAVGQRYELHPCLAVLLLTSGSTGTPRLVRLSRKNIQSASESTGKYLGLGNSDVAALALPLHFAAGLFVLNSHLLLGAKCVATDIPINSVHYPKWLREAGCTNFTGVPYAFEVFEQLAFRTLDIPDLKSMTVLGGKLPTDVVRKYATYLQKKGGGFYIDYGQTEANRAAYLPPEAVLTDTDCIGRASPGVELYLADEDGSRITEVNTPGELVIVGPNVMMGYATCGHDLSAGYMLKERRTGDIAERTTSGYFRILSRKARFSKIAGFRISHQNVEEHLAENGIAALVSGTDEYLVVALTGSDRVEDATKVVLQCTNLNSTQIRIFPLEEVPRLANGKPDYQTIKAIAGRMPVRRDGGDHANPILKAFAEAFWPLAVTEADSFNSLGGDSLTYVQLTLAIEKAIGKAPANWEDMPIAKLLSEGERHDRWIKMDPNTYLRAFAIILVVLDHLSNWGLRGGVPVLMILVGYNVARFQSKALFKGQVGLLGRTLAKNLLLYYFVLIFWLMYRQVFSLTHLLLVSNLFGASIIFGASWMDLHDIAYNSYWFVEAYAQILLFTICALSIPGVRRRVADRPLIYGICTTALSIGLIYIWRLTWHYPWNGCSQGPAYPVFEVAYLAPIGWCLYFAKSSTSKFLTAAGAILTFLSLNIFGKGMDNTPEVMTLVVVSILLISAHLRLPAPASISLFISTVAAYSYAIYLLHMVPYVLIGEKGGTWTWGIVPVSLGFALGFAGQWLFERLWKLFFQLRIDDKHGSQEPIAVRYQ